MISVVPEGNGVPFSHMAPVVLVIFNEDEIRVRIGFSYVNKERFVCNMLM